MNIILLLGVLYGLSSVMMAAYIDHGLALRVTGHVLNSLLTALRYHQLYAVLMTVIGLVLMCPLSERASYWLRVSASVFAIGLFLFSFSIYMSVMLGVNLYFITPIGGMVLMLAWLSLLGLIRCK